jgi:toxin FitB
MYSACWTLYADEVLVRLCLVDTSVAVPLLCRSHSAHASVSNVLDREKLFLPSHAAVETYSVLTRLPDDARVLPEDALLLLQDRFAGDFANSLNSLETVERFSDAGIAGGAVYDGLVAVSVLSAIAKHPKDVVVLFSRDVRASTTYERIGIPFELIR